MKESSIACPKCERKIKVFGYEDSQKNSFYELQALFHHWTSSHPTFWHVGMSVN